MESSSTVRVMDENPFVANAQVGIGASGAKRAMAHVLGRIENRCGFMFRFAEASERRMGHSWIPA